MASSDAVWSQVREAVDIVELVSEHVALKRAGKEFKGLCPFHDDHRPSMAVVPQKQIFHCFVCGTGGDVFKFVELYHKMTKGEALRFLAQKAGIKLPEFRGGSGPRSDKSVRETITETNERACGFFEKMLYAPEGRAGLEYLRQRGLTEETIKAFRLGMSPDKWTGLVDAALRLGASTDALFQAGLTKRRSDGSYYDAFRNRVIFPILDATARVIAFGGRVLAEKRDENGDVVEAKYLNSPETPVFVKSEALYGLDRAKQQIIKTQTAVVVEGYMDVIACHQAGVTNVVATLGTALTSQHAKMLRRFCNTVVLIFDSDDAGQRAADRALQTFVKEPLEIRIASVPDGKDPCDFCMARGDTAGAEFQKVIDSATEMMAYQWTRLQQQFNATSNLAARADAVREFMRFVAQGMAAASGGGRDMDPVRRGLLLTRLSSMVGLSLDEVSATLRSLATTLTPVHAPEEPAPAAAPASFSAAQLRGLSAAEGWVLGALLVDPQLYDRVREELSLQLFAPDCLHDLAAALLEYLEMSTDLAACSLRDFIGNDTLDSRLRDQAIQLESRLCDWLSPSNFSPEIERVLASQRADMGRSLDKLLLEALRELLARRGAEPEPAAPEEDLAFLSQAAQRNKKGGNPRGLGPRGL